MRMYPSKMKMLGFMMIGSDKVQVGVEEAIPAAEVHQFIDRLERLLDLIKSFFLLVAPEAANQSKVVGHVVVKDRREAMEIGGKAGSERSIDSSSGIHAPTRGQHLPPTSPIRRTVAPAGHAHQQHQPLDTTERRGTKPPIELSGHESGSTSLGSIAKKSKARNVKPKEDQQSVEA